MLNRPLCLLFTTLAASTLIGCAEGGLDPKLQDYTERLARVLDQTVPARPALPTVTFPEKRDMALTMTTESIDLLDFLRLGDCELQGVIADKNSSLGRFAANSLVLKQELDFIRLASVCADTLEDQALEEKLRLALQQKRAQIKGRLWNAVIAGPEYREFWTKDAGGYPSNIESRLEYALNDLQRITSVVDKASTSDQLDEPAFDPETFESALAVLRSGEAGALTSSWHEVAVNLRQATQVLSARVERKPLCFPGMNNPKAQYFRNLVVQKFAGDLQRDIAILNKRYYEVIEPLRVLEQSFTDVETPAYAEFRQARDDMLNVARSEVRAHVDGLQPLMLQCGFLNQAPDDE